MKALILAAGYATRLYPLTKDTPKPLLYVGKERMIDHILKQIEEIDDIDEVLVVTNDRFYDQFATWKEQIQSTKSIEIINDHTKNNEDRLGAVRDIELVIRKKNIQSPLLVIAGDNLFFFSLKDFYLFFQKKHASVLGVYDIQDKRKAAHTFGVVNLDATQQLIGFEEKPKEPKTSLVATACYWFTAEDLKLLTHCVKEHQKLDGPGEFINYLTTKRPVYGFLFKEPWFDVGTVEQYTALHAKLSAVKGQSFQDYLRTLLS